MKITQSYKLQKVCCKNSEKGVEVSVDLGFKLGYFKNGKFQVISFDIQISWHLI